MTPNVLRNIPSVQELLERPPLKALVDKVSHSVVVSGVRTFLDDLRSDLVRRTEDVKLPAGNELAERIAQWIWREQTPVLRPVVNATGVILHTGLGRSPLAASALDHVRELAAGYCSLEMDLKSGQRSQRVEAVRKLLCERTKADAAAVVNNNAAATLITLAALATGREVIVSRGQLIEIGGSFRLPEIMACSGARLREVGTTNKTRVDDYAQAITDQTAAILRVHSSNYRIVGFTEQPPLEELVALGRSRGLPVIDDIGSGALVDFSRYGIEDEPSAPNSVERGADLVLFSGDKLLGGPQCGIIVGRRELVARITRHPMMRAVRVGKMTLAALAATLRLYRDLDVAEREIPLLALLTTSPENLKNRAERLAAQVSALDLIQSAEPVAEITYLGGGSVPEQTLPTWCVAVTPAKGSVDALAESLRAGNPSVVGRVQRERLLLDLRSVLPGQDALIVTAMTALGDQPE